jgi:hypothetical protein
MLLGIPGDNTYSNYQEAQRAFWRGTVLPLVARMTKAFSGWLAPAYAFSGPPSAGRRLSLKPDLDQVEGLSAEREALWARLNAATFLTVNEKRAAVGYGPVDITSPGTTPEAKAGFDPNQPRVPEGNEDGGQWTDAGGGGGSSSSGRVRVAQADTGTRNDAGEQERFIQLAQNSPSGPEDDGPQRIPAAPPPKEGQRLSIVKEVARTLTTLADFVRITSGFPPWFVEYGQLLRTALDDPRELEELQNSASGSGFGYNVHHIVEQTPARNEGFPEGLINGPDNLVRVPTLKHWKINAWYSRSNDEFGGLSPREYLRGKSWEEKRQLGLQVLIDQGILKP